MSDVKRYIYHGPLIPRTAAIVAIYPTAAKYVPASDYDALQQRFQEANNLADQWAEKNEQLAQRCRELEVERDDAKADAVMVHSYEAECLRLISDAEQERDTLRAEVEALRNRRIMIPTNEVLDVLEELRAFTLEHDSGRAGVLRGKIDAILRCREASQ